MPEPRGIDNVFVEVGDLDEAVGWYERVVGLTLKVRTPDMAVLDVGGDVAGIVLSSADQVSPTKVWFEVADARDAATELGVQTFPIPTGLTAEVVDPWGNRIGFTDYTARPDLARS
ncbi:putative enzyme related to lactoylglutathione lyase [Microbacterium sp. SORGH_AS428]|uniref:VOC family protein n=1 Tax=Microbacterium sp. SORGH_AS_0428 TaxID=3041788 RepID=UPI002854645A|nr:VOC family protein [Microbacterium sp. SORGH_AS_0428]MDR6199642.1 putative enzyme related to lactoylglutathione lyase [Microbacterium sp. SORGH_AS_0428]